MDKIVVILANYFKESELMAFISSQLLTQKEVDMKVIVVDNGSNNGSLLEAFVREHPTIILIKPSANRGYIGAAADGYTYCKKNDIEFDYFVLMNFDLMLNDSLLFKNLVVKAKQLGSALSAPQVMDKNSGVKMNPMYRERLPKSHLARLIRTTSFWPVYLAYQILHKIKRKISPKGASPIQSGCYALHGSFLGFAPSFFEKGGKLNYGSFLYGEEIFIAEQCRKLNLSLNLISEFQIVHDEHSTTGKWKNKAHMLYLHQSLIYLNSTYYNE
jgi:GT2 family glycosyltransferase